MFFACSQSAALLMLASGAIVATSVPFCLRMLSIVIAASPGFAVAKMICPRVRLFDCVGNTDCDGIAPV